MRKEKLEELKSYIEEFKTIKTFESVEQPGFLKARQYKFCLGMAK